MDKELQRCVDLLTSQGELVGSLAHDLKGLMTGIEGGLYMIESGQKKKKRARIEEGFGMLRRNLSRMRRTVGHVMYYVKDRELAPAPLDTRQVIEAAGAALAERAETLGVALRLEPGDGTFSSDELAVHSILVNIAEHCLEACHQARAASAPAVTLSAVVDARRAALEVTAVGFCVEPDVVEIARGQTYSTRSGDRAHLGLFIANKLATQLLGVLKIDRQPDSATTRFTVTLPHNEE